jgi:hypothetical protein
VLTRLPVAGSALTRAGRAQPDLIRDHDFRRTRPCSRASCQATTWISDLARSIALIGDLRGQAGDDVVVSLCSLQHSRSTSATSRASTTV